MGHNGRGMKRKKLPYMAEQGEAAAVTASPFCVTVQRPG